MAQSNAVAVTQDTDWVSVASNLSREFAATATERERKNQRPDEELRKLRTSGIVNLVIPRAYGGEGADEDFWLTIVRVIVEISKADPNIGLLLAYHFHNFIPPIYDFEGDNAAIQKKSAQNRWLWGHVTHPAVQDFHAEPQADGGLIVTGTKPINTGAPTADVTTVLARRTDRNEFIYSVIPTDRKGLTFIPDWDHLGLRRSDTSTIVFDHVRIEPHEVLTRSHQTPFVTFHPFYSLTGSLCFGAAYLGAALGVLENAREYVLRKQPGPTGPAASDPFVLQRFGDYRAKTWAGIAHLETVTREFDQLYAWRRTADPVTYDRPLARAEAFRVFVGQIGLEVGSGVYEALGASATAHRYGFDRFWRDVRNHSLHVHPPIYSDRILGNYFLNGNAPRTPNFFQH